MTTLGAIDDPGELAELRQRRAARRRHLGIILAAATLATGYFGWRVGSHAIAARWLEANEYQVDWRFDRETWRQGGLTTVKMVVSHNFFSGHHSKTDLKFLPWLHRVESLDLSLATGLRDADLAGLGELTELRSLNLDRTAGQAWIYDPGRLTDATLARIRSLTHLHDLSLGGQRITDDGLANLAGLGELRTLDLRGNPITDAGLRHLQGLRGLKSLDLTFTGITARGVREFEAARPGVGVLAEPPPEPIPAKAAPSPGAGP